MTAAERLVAWAWSLRLGDVPAAARQAATRHLLDGYACAVAAVRHTAALPAVTVAREAGGPPEATVIASAGGRIGAPAAAFANGVLVHALDFDDTHAGGLVHATAPVLPVALAVGEEVGARGAEVLVAALAGYEAICRLGAAVPHGFHARGLHATSVCGTFAAAVVASRLYGLSEAAAVHSLGIAGSQAGGLLEFLNTGGSTKQLHPGFAAQAGITAARLARAGATGPPGVLDGGYGLYAALLGRPGLDPFPDLGERWEVTRITVKPYPACQLVHAALDAARLLPPGAAAGPLVVETHPDAAPIVCGPGKEHPATPYQAKFSLPWSVAAMIIDGEVTAATYHRVDRPDVLDLAARIGTRVAGSGGVAADQPCRILDATGAVLAEVPHSSGGPDDPGRDGLVRRKALANGASPELVSAFTDLADLPDLAGVTGGSR